MYEAISQVAELEEKAYIELKVESAALYPTHVMMLFSFTNRHSESSPVYHICVLGDKQVRQGNGANLIQHQDGASRPAGTFQEDTWFVQPTAQFCQHIAMLFDKFITFFII